MLNITIVQSFWYPWNFSYFNPSYCPLPLCSSEREEKLKMVPYMEPEGNLIACGPKNYTSSLLFWWFPCSQTWYSYIVVYKWDIGEKWVFSMTEPITLLKSSSIWIRFRSFSVPFLRSFSLFFPFSCFYSPQPPLSPSFILLSPLLFISKIFCVMISIFAAWEWIDCVPEETVG